MLQTASSGSTTAAPARAASGFTKTSVTVNDSEPAAAGARARAGAAASAAERDPLGVDARVARSKQREDELEVRHRRLIRRVEPDRLGELLDAFPRAGLGFGRIRERVDEGEDAQLVRRDRAQPARAATSLDLGEGNLRGRRLGEVGGRATLKRARTASPEELRR